MGSSDSRPEHPKTRHFTEVNPRVLASQTSNPTHPRPISTTRVPTNTTTTRTPNYLYQVPRDEDIDVGTRANRSAAASGSTIRTSSSTTVSNTGSSSVSYTAGNTVPRTPNSSMPSTATSVTTAKPYGSNTASSYNSSALGNKASTSVSRNENNSVNSNVSTVSTPKPQEGINTISMNSKLEKLDLNNANYSTMNATTSSGSIGSSQYPLNKRNSASKENLNSEHKRNAYRRRGNNASGDSQARHRPQFNNQSDSGNRQPRDRNHRPIYSHVYTSNSEEMRGNNRNRPNDPRNRQHPRSRTPRNVFSDDSRTENNSGDDRTKEVHDAFMKKLVGTFPPNYDKFRGLFCAACNHYEIFIGRRPNVKHIDTQKHISNMREKPRIKSMSCSNCKIILHCDVQFLVAHKQCEIHMFIADQKPRSAEGCTEPSNQVENGVEGASEQAENVVKGENTLNLKIEIKEKFLQRLDLSSEINDYSFYCHLCEQWFTSHEVWDEHLKNQHNDDDRKVMNTTFKHCQQCKVMMCGSRLLSIFHTDAGEHDKFRTFLNIPSIENDDDDDARDDVSTTSSAAARDQNSQKPVYLVLKNLPSMATKRDIFAYFKDFGHLENWTMNPIGENTAVVQFRFGSVAENLIKSKFPLEIHGSRIDAGLQYL